MDNVSNQLVFVVVLDNSLNEYYAPIKTKHGSPYRIYIRSAKEGARSGAISQHAPSIKIVENVNKETPIIIPVTPFTELEPVILPGIIKGYSSEVKNYIKSFIYENHMYILAIWFNLDDRVNNKLQELFT